MRTINFILFICLIFIAKISFSQITINNNDMPSAGNVFFTAKASQISLDYATTGQNMTWDFSMLDTLSTKTDTIRTVLSTNAVYVAMFNNIFDQEHLASFAYQGDNSNLSNNFIQIDNVYYFFQNTNNHYSIVGFGAVVNGVPTAAKYNDPEKYFDFPLNYGTSDSSVSIWSISVPNFGYYGQTIRRNFKVDGWGTITTPAGTFQCIRVKNLINTRDTFYIDSLSFGTAFNRPEQTEYVWITTGEGIPVLKATGSNGNITNVSYKIYSLPSAISSKNQNNFVNGYYVPYLKTVFVENPTEKNLFLQIFSINGSIIYSGKSNKNIIKIQNNKFKTGVFILQVTDKTGNRFVKKIAP